MESTVSVEHWLKALNLEQFLENFTKSGYTSLEKCAHLEEVDLNRLSVNLPGHRQRILGNLPNLNEIQPGTCHEEQSPAAVGNSRESEYMNVEFDSETDAIYSNTGSIYGNTDSMGNILPEDESLPDSRSSPEILLKIVEEVEEDYINMDAAVNVNVDTSVDLPNLPEKRGSVFIRQSNPEPRPTPKPRRNTKKTLLVNISTPNIPTVAGETDAPVQSVRPVPKPRPRKPATKCPLHGVTSTKFTDDDICSGPDVIARKAGSDGISINVTCENKVQTKTNRAESCDVSESTKVNVRENVRTTEPVRQSVLAALDPLAPEIKSNMNNSLKTSPNLTVNTHIDSEPYERIWVDKQPVGRRVSDLIVLQSPGPRTKKKKVPTATLR